MTHDRPILAIRRATVARRRALRVAMLLAAAVGVLVTLGPSRLVAAASPCPSAYVPTPVPVGSSLAKFDENTNGWVCVNKRSGRVTDDRTK
jgi:hypothetical protein